MKTTAKARTKKTTTLLVAVLALLSMTNLFAQTNSVLTPKAETAIENLSNGIKSENEGLKRSSIYLAGKYAIDGLVDDLVAQLKKEANPSDRHLIVLSLYKIGNPEGMKAVNETAKYDLDARVRRLAAAIYEGYLNENDYKYVSVKD